MNETQQPSDDDTVIAPVARLLDGARGVLFITGAGVSADSGLPTYRGVGGLYDDGGTEDGVPIEVALSGPMMRKDPALCWKYIAQIERACRGARPNPAHHAIAAIGRKLERVWVLTQNVDGFHRDAGSGNLIEVHGNIHDLRCTQCGDRVRVPDYAELDIPPACKVCAGLVRPEVVLFEEMLPPGAISTLEREMDRGFDVVVSVGTTSVFPYIAGPVLQATRSGRPTVEINPGDSEVSHAVRHRLKMGAADALGRIVRAMGI